MGMGKNWNGNKCLASVGMEFIPMGMGKLKANPAHL